MLTHWNHLQQAVAEAKTEATEKKRIETYLRSLKHRRLPKVIRHHIQQGKKRNLVRIYVWEDVDFGDGNTATFALQSGPQFKGELKYLIPSSSANESQIERTSLVLPASAKMPQMIATSIGSHSYPKKKATKKKARKSISTASRRNASVIPFSRGRKSTKAHFMRHNPALRFESLKSFVDRYEELEDIGTIFAGVGLFLDIGGDQVREIRPDGSLGDILNAADAWYQAGERMYEIGQVKIQRKGPARGGAYLGLYPKAAQALYDLEVGKTPVVAAPPGVEQPEPPPEPILPEPPFDWWKDLLKARMYAHQLYDGDFTDRLLQNRGLKQMVQFINKIIVPLGGEAAPLPEPVPKVKPEPIFEPEPGFEKHFPPNSYFYRFFKEKDIPEVMFEFTTPSGEFTIMPNEVVIEHIAIAPAHEQEGIKATLRNLDFANADINDYLKHLAMALAVARERQEPEPEVEPEPPKVLDEWKANKNELTRELRVAAKREDEGVLLRYHVQNMQPYMEIPEAKKLMAESVRNWLAYMELEACGTDDECIAWILDQDAVTAALEALETAPEVEVEAGPKWNVVVPPEGKKELGYSQGVRWRVEPKGYGSNMTWVTIEYEVDNRTLNQPWGDLSWTYSDGAASTPEFVDHKIEDLNVIQSKFGIMHFDSPVRRAYVESVIDRIIKDHPEKAVSQRDKERLWRAIPEAPEPAPIDQEKYTGKIAKELRRLKKDLGFKSIKQEYKGTGSQKANRQMWTRGPGAAVIDIWIYPSMIGFGQVVAMNSKGERIRPVPSSIPHEATIPETYEKVKEILANWLPVELPEAAPERVPPPETLVEQAKELYDAHGAAIPHGKGSVYPFRGKRLTKKAFISKIRALARKVDTIKDEDAFGYLEVLEIRLDLAPVIGGIVKGIPLVYKDGAPVAPPPEPALTQAERAAQQFQMLMKMLEKAGYGE